MTQRTIEFSVIICAYADERWNDLVAAVKSAQQQTLPPKEVIVVIDHNAALRERASQFLSGVVVVESRGEQGLSGARNSGIARASGEILAFLDDDAVASPDWLASLAKGYAHPRVMGSGGQVLPRWPEKTPAWLPEEFYWVVGCTYRGMPETVATVRNPIGANMAFRREVFDAVGGFRSGVGRVGTRPVGCEETELCIRARQHWPERAFLFQPRAIVYHRVTQGRTSWRYFHTRCFAEGLSKAIISRFVGPKDSLASERSYTLKTLPQGVLRGLTDAVLRRDLSGLLRAGAIVAGFGVTTVGYLVGRAKATINKPASVPGAAAVNLRHDTEALLPAQAEV